MKIDHEEWWYGDIGIWCFLWENHLEVSISEVRLQKGTYSMVYSTLPGMMIPFILYMVFGISWHIDEMVAEIFREGTMSSPVVSSVIRVRVRTSTKEGSTEMIVRWCSPHIRNYHGHGGCFHQLFIIKINGECYWKLSRLPHWRDPFPKKNRMAMEYE